MTGFWLFKGEHRLRDLSARQWRPDELALKNFATTTNNAVAISWIRISKKKEISAFSSVTE